MLIPVSTRDCRAACAAAIAAAEIKYSEDKGRLAENSFNQLHDGAVHNGLKPSPAEVQQMRDMVSRDVEHMMENHQSNVVIKHLKTMMKMIDYIKDKREPDVIIDEAEFELLHEHLPPKE